MHPPLTAVVLCSPGGFCPHLSPMAGKSRGPVIVEGKEEGRRHAAPHPPRVYACLSCPRRTRVE